MIELSVKKADSMRQSPLEVGYHLQRYRIERVLGESSFAVTYLARDMNLDRLVAVREYLPAHLATRDGPVFVHPLRDDLDERYHAGLELFLSEARVLAKIDHPNIVRVLNVFVNHNTAYMVMLYEDGRSLAELLEESRTLDEAELLDILMPVLDGLERVHKSGYLHRDIRPANILIRQDGSPVLIDFGSARFGLGEVITDAAPSQFTALEQYYEKSDQQGPWTDIYGLAATIYRSIAGVPPADALQRSQAILHGAKDPLIAAAQVGGSNYSPPFLRALDNALNLNPSKRPQTISHWRRAIGGTYTMPASTLAVSEAPTLAPEKLSEEPFRGHVDDDHGSARNEVAKSRWSLLIPLLIGAAAGIVALLFINKPDSDTEVELAATTPQSTAPELPAAATPAEPATDRADSSSSSLGAEALPPSHLTATQAQTSNSVESPSPAAQTSENTAPARVTALLKEAQAALDSGRLLEPPADNALDRYRAVLTIVPNHAEAQAGLQHIAEALIKQTREALSAGQLDNANVLLEKAALIRPGIDGLDILRTELLTLRRNEEERDEKRRQDDALRSKRDLVVDRLVQNARTAMRRLQWTKAEEFLNQAAELAPAAEDVKDLRQQLNTRRMQAAEVEHTPSPVPTESSPASEQAMPYAALAREAINKKQWKRAESNLKKGLTLDPESPELAELRETLSNARSQADAVSQPTPTTRINSESPSDTVVVDEQAIEKQSLPSPTRDDSSVGLRPEGVSQSELARPEDQVANVRPGRRLQSRDYVRKEAPDRLASTETSSDSLGVADVSTTEDSVAPGSAGLNIRSASSNYDVVSPGETIEFATEYELTLPNGEKRELVEVQWVLKRDGRKLGQEGVESKMVNAGINVATNQFTLPAYMKPGNYIVEHRVQSAGRTVSARTYFTVTATRR